MIDVNTETIVTFSQLARRLPYRRNSRPTHVSTIHRWRANGVRGVHLDAVRLGGTWATSLEAYARFCAELTSDADGRSVTVPPKSPQRVDAMLDAAGV